MTELYNTIKNICISNHFYLDISTKNVDGNQKIKSFIFKLIQEDTSRVIALENGEIDLCIQPPTIQNSYIEDNEDLLLKITYELLSEYPEAVLWLEQNWFYKLDDIKKYILSEFDPNWCYQRLL